MLRYYGYTDGNIILMLADEFAANPRNPVKNGVFNTAADSLQNSGQAGDHQRPSLQSEGTEIDYRGEDVTVENLITVLTGRSGNGVMPVLESDEGSNVLIYLTGHGGDQFFKFQDVEEIAAEQLAETLHQMHMGRKYRQVLLVADTCQAFTLGDAIIARGIPNVSVIGTSLRGESSYAHSGNSLLGLSVIEKYTHYFVEHVRSNGRKRTMHEATVSEAMLEPFSYRHLGANVGMTDANCDRKLTDVPLRDYFANVQSEKFWYNEGVAEGKEQRSGNVRALGAKTATEEQRPVKVQLLLELTVRFISTFPSDGGGDRRRRGKTKIENRNEGGQCAASESQREAGRYSVAPTVNYEEVFLRKPGMEPSEPLFVLLVIGLIGSVTMASRRW